MTSTKRPSAKVVSAAYNKWEWDNTRRVWPAAYIERQFYLDKYRKKKTPFDIAQKFMIKNAERERRISMLEREILAYEDIRQELLKFRAAFGADAVHQLRERGA